jgi:hypothetical protein
MQILKAFVAGFVSVLVLHQSVVAVLYGLGLTQRAPWALTPTAPLGVPQVVSLAFWGGVWGVVLWPLVTRLAARTGYWVAAVVLGAIGPSMVAWFVVAPLKGQPVANGWQVAALAIGLLVNGVWGFGLALLMRLAERYHIGETGRYGTAA